VSEPGPEREPARGGGPRAPGDRPVRWGRALGLFALLPAGLGLLRLGAARPDLVEAHYSGALFPRVRDALRAAAELAPVPAAQGLLLALAGLSALGIVRAGRERLAGRRSLTNLAAHGLARTAALAGVLYAAFLLSWGLNHARRPYAHHAGLAEHLPAAAGVPAQELVELGAWLVEECNRLREATPASELALRPGPGGVDPRLEAGYAELARDVPALAAQRPLLRRAFLSPALSRLGISGIYSPFTAEAHVNGEVAPWLLPFTAAHELAHYRGFAREDEANFIAWQVLRRCPEPALAYSGTLAAAAHLLAQLGRDDPAALEALRGRLHADVAADLEANRAFWRARRTPVVTDLARSSNDAYLRSQGQPEGLRSYGRMVDLLIAERRRALRGERGEASALPTAPPPG
jgi:hypothetical protein